MNRLVMRQGIAIALFTCIYASTAIAAHGKHPQKQVVFSSAASSLSTWELSGAMAASQRKRNGRNQGWTASLNWLQQGPNQYQIRLFGPMGGGTVIIEKHGAVVTLRDGPKRRSSNNADGLLQRETGVRLPVKNLYYWVRGLPAPGAVHSLQQTADHRVISFSQQGYTISYTEYTSAGGIILPGKIRLEGNGIKVRMVIKRWRI